jgi:hypothetical protein
MRLGRPTHLADAKDAIGFGRIDGDPEPLAVFDGVTPVPDVAGFCPELLVDLLDFSKGGRRCQSSAVVQKDCRSQRNETDPSLM